MKNNFQKIALLLSILLFISLCFVYGYFYNKIQENSQNAEQAKIALQLEIDKRDRVNALENSMQQISDNKDLLETHFARSSDVVPFLNTIESLAPWVGAKAQIDSVETGTGNTKLVVGVSASGSFDSVYKFLTLLENSPYELNFLSMDIHKTTPIDPSLKTNKDLSWQMICKIQLISYLP